jgi:hypothetical protein
MKAAPACRSTAGWSGYPVPQVSELRRAILRVFRKKTWVWLVIRACGTATDIYSPDNRSLSKYWCRELLSMKAIVLRVIGLAGFFGVSFAAQKPMAFAGEILDIQCASAYSGHIKEAENCTLRVKNGARYALFDPATSVAYQLDDQKKARNFAAHRVWVMGTLDETTTTIHVKSMGTAAGVQNTAQWGVRFR